MLCVICSKELTGRQTSVCSRTCSIKHNGNKRREAGKLRKENMTPEAYARKSAAGKRDSDKHRSSRLALRVCAVCGETRWINKTHAKTRLTCSAVCYSYLQLPNGWSKSTDMVTYTESAEVAKKPVSLTKPRVIKPQGPWFRAGYCRICACAFVSRKFDTFCSETCRRELRTRRRESWISASHRKSLYERDGWTCLICYEPVSVDRYSHETYNPHYPSLDHIVPKSLGGTHDDSNLRTAHVHCNSLRGTGITVKLDSLVST